MASAIGDLLAGAAGRPVDRQGLQAFVANSQALNGLRSAQTEEAMTNAQKLVEQQKARGQFEQALIGSGMDASEAHMIATTAQAGLGDNFAATVKGLGGIQEQGLTATASDPNKLGTPAATAAVQGLSHKVAEPFAIPETYGVQPGMPQPTVQQTPLGAAHTAAAQATAGLTTEKTEHPELFRAGGGPASAEDLATRARMVATGQLPPPSQYEWTRNPQQAAQVTRMAESLNPDISAQLQPQIAAAVKDFSGAGKNGQAIIGYRTVENHIQLLQGAMTALGNGDVQGLNWIGNKVAQMTGSTAPVDAQLIPQFVATEAMRALARNGIGTGKDRDNLQAPIDAMKLAPDQGVSVLKTMTNLLQGGKGSLQASYNSGVAGHGGGPGVPSFDDIYNGTVGQKPALPTSNTTPIVPPGTTPPVGQPGAVNPLDHQVPTMAPNPTADNAAAVPAGTAAAIHTGLPVGAAPAPPPGTPPGALGPKMSADGKNPASNKNGYPIRWSGKDVGYLRPDGGYEDVSGNPLATQ